MPVSALVKVCALRLAWVSPLPEPVAPLRFTFERWNGNGYPAGASGKEIPLAMRGPDNRPR